MSELEALRSEISELDRRLLELLNRRLELVASVRDYKDSAGERWIDPEREADLLQALVAANPGPLSERGVTSIFSAVAPKRSSSSFLFVFGINSPFL